MIVLERLEKGSGLPLPPMIEAWNKIDVLPEARAIALRNLAATGSEPPAVAVSALTGEGMDDLLALIEKSLLRGRQEVEIHLTPEAGRARAWLHRNGAVIGDETAEDGSSRLRDRLSPERLGQFRAEFPEIVATLAQ